MTDKQVIERLRAALELAQPSCRAPGCWCAVSWGSTKRGHSPSCMVIRAALAEPQDEPHCSWCNSKLTAVCPKCDPSSQAEPVETRTERETRATALAIAHALGVEGV